MKVYGDFRFLGVESRPGFKDKTKINYIIALSQGIDTLRLFIEPETFSSIQSQMVSGKMTPFCTVRAEMEYNPTAEKTQYCMRLVDIKESKGGN